MRWQGANALIRMQYQQPRLRRAAAYIDFGQPRAFKRASKVRGSSIKTTNTMRSPHPRPKKA